MNTLLNQAQTWLTELGVTTQFQNTSSLFVSKQDVNSIGGPQELLNSLRNELNNKKLYWNDNEETIGWYILQSF